MIRIPGVQQDTGEGVACGRVIRSPCTVSLALEWPEAEFGSEALSKAEII